MKTRRCISQSLLLLGIGAMLALAAAPALAQTADALRAAEPPPNAMWLDGLDLSTMMQDYGAPHAGKSVDNQPLRLDRIVYAHGIGTHANSQWMIDLKGAATKFTAMVGVDDERTGGGSVVFEVWADGKKQAATPVMHGGDAPQLLSVDVTGAKRMLLQVTDAGDGISNDHADWAGAMLVLKPGAKARPEALKALLEPALPIASGVPLEPAIHGPRIVGATPGRPFLFLIPATGEGPLSFAAKGLPAGLSLDPQTGIISGSLERGGRTVVELTVSGPRGVARRKLVIVGGWHKLALTPPMGWNSWNCWAGAVDDAKVRAAADWMVRTGLAAHGYQFINIDDTWEGGRDPGSGRILTNKKFPDMKALADYVHSKGLKLGIYSSPGPTTCAGFEASYGREQQDADSYAEWGIDYLKYDWCSYGGIARNDSLPELQKPYRVMRYALDRCSRDIVYSLCQYGMGDVWKWAADVGGNLWRTTGDINDSWNSMSGIGFSQDGHEKYAGPGHWNDPDMLVVGKVGWGNLHPTHLKPNEQITHITLWCLLSAPLLTGCDLAQLEQFTIDLLTNDEVLDVNQDPLGRPAGRRAKVDTAEVWARPLWDGTMAVGFFNRGADRAPVTAQWSDLKLTGRQPVRDLWEHKDLGEFEGSFTASVPAHGAVLVKIGAPTRSDW